MYITSERNAQGMDITSEKNVQGTDITYERNVKGIDITCEKKVQGTESCLQGGYQTFHHTVCPTAHKNLRSAC